jgi:hypothetical protein
VDLPAFLLSKNVCPDPVRAPQQSAETLSESCDRTIKNPASSAGLSRLYSGSARSSTDFYPVLVKNLTIGSTAGLRLVLRWEDAAYSTRL